jgi:lysozyme
MANCNAIVDLSHHNGVVDLVKAKQDGIVGIIQKASQGQANTDPTYKTNRRLARDAGLLWGAYHFGTDSDGVMQAEHFLAAADPEPGDILVLDFEDNPTGPSMTLEEARAFVTHLREATGCVPGFYSGHTIKRLLGAATDPILAECWFWLAQYGPTAVVPANWASWTLWQYTDGALGPEPHQVAGIGRCDRDRFNGDPAGLIAFWKGAAVPAPYV